MESVVFKRIVAAFFMFIMLSNEMVLVAQAQPAYDEPFYSSNDILYYDPRCDTGKSEGISLELNGKDNLEKILKFLIAPEQGLTLAQASGVLGNLMAESSLDPTIIQGNPPTHASPGYTPVNGVGFGIAQWTFTARQGPLVQYAKQYEGGHLSLDAQVGFMWSELTGTHQEALRALKTSATVLDATVAFHRYYEGSADSAARVQEVRGGFADKIYNQYKDAESIGGSSVDSSMLTGENATSAIPQNEFTRSCNATSTGNSLIDYVRRYAWDTYRGVGTQEAITPKEDYRAAVQTALGDGRYVGGIRHKGIDCGGFVTLLVVDSGFDPQYNSAGRGGYTVIQESWLQQNWERISDVDPTDRQPGDVAINSSHTYIYVGPDAFNNKEPIASASLDERAPMQGSESVVNTTSGSQFRWYRKPMSKPSTSIPANPGGGGGSW